MTPDPLVLVVDDLPQNVRLLEAVLSPKGFRVATASSGEEALDVLSKEHPDLVLLDILMPGMDGYEVCRRIREDPETAFLPVIMITASGGQEKTTGPPEQAACRKTPAESEPQGRSLCPSATPQLERYIIQRKFGLTQVIREKLKSGPPKTPCAIAYRPIDGR